MFGFRAHFLLAALTLSAAALGANPKASALAKDADRLYKDNKYKEAAETLRQAYEADPNGLYLYNIARAYDQAAELELSQEYYRKYVALPSDEAQPDLVKKANLAMDRIRTLLARGSADKQVREAEKQRLEADAKKAEARADAEAAEARKQRQEFAEKEKVRKEAENKQVNVRKLAAYGTGGVAIVGLGMALGFGIGTNGNRESFRTADTLTLKKQYEGATRTTAAVADVSLIVGVAAAVATVILYPKGEEAEKSVTVVFAPVSGGGVAALGGTF
jgi:tetratricopeptide (TPR) repeat protein